MSQHTGADDITIGCAGSESLCVSAAAYAARAGMRSVSLLDGTVAETGGRAIDAIDGVGGRAVGVAAPESRWSLLADAERMLGWRAISNRASPPIGGDPLGIEGYKTIAYEIAEQLGFAVPDLVVVPAGLGDGIAGIWRGFRELADWGVVDAYPRMVAVEVGGALAAALAGGRDWVEPSVETTTNARALAGITGTVQSLHAVTESEGLVVRVTEPELEAARIILGEQEGIWADLAAAAPVAAAQKLASAGGRAGPRADRLRRHRARPARRLGRRARHPADGGRQSRRAAPRAGGAGRVESADATDRADSRPADAAREPGGGADGHQPLRGAGLFALR